MVWHVAGLHIMLDVILKVVDVILKVVELKLEWVSL